MGRTKRIFGSFNWKGKICLLGDFNARVEDIVVERVVGPFEDEGKNENGEN